MSHTPVGGHPQGWDHKLADRSSLPPASGEEKNKSQSRHVFSHPHQSKGSMLGREETEGSSGSSPTSADPPYIRWARSLHDLLEDEEGVRQFRSFVCEAGGLHLDRFNFYFAVRGLRQETEPGKIRQVVSAIYRFVRKSQLAMPEELKSQVKSLLKEGGAIERSIFDGMEAAVTRAISDTTYSAFLKSEAYVAYVAANCQPLASPEEDTKPVTSAPSARAGLPTLHEGQELSGSSPARLTADALLATQNRRLHSEIPPGFGRHKPRSAYTSHLSYAGYTPASRIDSERASLSSGRADSDAVSMSGSSVDGMSVRGVPDKSKNRQYGIDRHTIINRDSDAAMMIPRTQRVQADRVLRPPEFAKLLIDKLERVRRDIDNKERLERRLAEDDNENVSGGLPPAVVAAAIREKLQLDDDNDQDILDQHVSRVWSERTPLGSPPARRAPPRRRAPSTLSADSGHYDDPRRSLSRAAPTETTDSGVSLFSEPRVCLWLDSNRRAARLNTARPPGPGDECSVVVVSFLDEPLPYRIRIPAAPLTLRTFKDYLPRKGNYRYFFKTECADLDNTVIQEEVSNDGDLLPLYEGKVMARVKSIE